jgi:hypothetical protein
MRRKDRGSSSLVRVVETVHLEVLCSTLADLSVSDVNSLYLRVSESIWRASHTLCTSSQIMIRDRPTNLMCCWHLHRGKRRELVYGTARLADGVTGVLASVDVAIGLCTMWRALVEQSSTPQMIGCPSRFRCLARFEHRTGRLLQQNACLPASELSRTALAIVGLVQKGQSRFAWSGQPVGGVTSSQPSLRKSAWQPGYTLMQWNAVDTVCQYGAE